MAKNIIYSNSYTYDAVGMWAVKKTSLGDQPRIFKMRK